MNGLSTQQQRELLAQWARAREQRDAALAVLDQASMAGCQDIDNPSQHCHDKISTIKEMVDAFSKLKTQHDEMHRIEQRMAAVQPDRDWSPFAEPLQQLRQQRVQRPRILCSHSVSCRTGQGLSMMQRGLTALMEDTLLFAHVGAKVPLNYSMLERLAHEGRAVASEGPENDEIAIQADRADWEQAVTKHVLEQASAGLRKVCSQACVSLVALEEAAGAVGMEKAEVHSALLFLHATGSVLHYGTNTCRGSHALQGTVFMRPQFIIDAISYVIRESNATDVNDEVRTQDARIRQSVANGEALDRFLGTENTHGSGVLTRQLLRHLWRHLNPQHHTLLLELMKAFNLLRPLADTETFLVPAKFPRQQLPSV